MGLLEDYRSVENDKIEAQKEKLVLKRTKHQQSFEDLKVI